MTLSVRSRILRLRGWWRSRPINVSILCRLPRPYPQILWVTLWIGMAQRWMLAVKAKACVTVRENSPLWATRGWRQPRCARSTRGSAAKGRHAPFRAFSDLSQVLSATVTSGSVTNSAAPLPQHYSFNRHDWCDASRDRRTHPRGPSRDWHVAPLGHIENTRPSLAFSQTDVLARWADAAGLHRRQTAASIRTLAPAALKIPLQRSRRPAFFLAYDRSFRSWNSVRSWFVEGVCHSLGDELHAVVPTSS
jgi:hypothetical protein